MVAHDVPPGGPDEVVLDVPALLGRDRRQIVNQVVAARHLDEPRRVAQALVEDLARVVVEPRPRTDAVVGMGVGVRQEQFPGELGVAGVAREDVDGAQVGDVGGQLVVDGPVGRVAEGLLVAQVHPLPVRTLLRLGDAEGPAEAVVHRLLEAGVLELKLPGGLQHLLVMADVFLVPERARMAMRHARLADDLDLALGGRARRRGGVGRRGRHTVLVHILHQGGHVGRRKDGELGPATPVRPFRPVGERADRVVLGHQDADRLALDRRVQVDADGLARRLGQAGVLDLRAFNEDVDGLGLHRAVVVEARDLDGPDLHGDHQADVDAAALERSAEDGAVAAAREGIIGRPILVEGRPAPLGRRPQVQERRVVQPRCVRAVRRRRGGQGRRHDQDRRQRQPRGRSPQGQPFAQGHRSLLARPRRPGVARPRPRGR